MLEVLKYLSSKCTTSQNVLQSHSNKNAIILAQTQIHRIIKYNRRPRNKPKQVLPSDFLIKVPKTCTGEKAAYLTSGSGKTEHAHTGISPPCTKLN
jgi:hypothetical protein